MKVMKKIVVASIIVLMLGANMFTGNLIDACEANHDCGAHCQTFGDCGGAERCKVYANSVFCSCLGVSAAFYCDGTIFHSED